MAPGPAQGRDRRAAVQRPHGRPRLDEAAFARLEDGLNRGPAAHGQAHDQRWPLGRAAEVIRWLFGVDYTRPGVSLLLRRNGWSVLVPGRLAIERDSQAIEVRNFAIRAAVGN